MCSLPLNKESEIESFVLKYDALLFEEDDIYNLHGETFSSGHTENQPNTYDDAANVC